MLGSLLGGLTRKFWVTSDRNGTVSNVLEGNYLESHHATLRQDLPIRSRRESVRMTWAN